MKIIKIEDACFFEFPVARPVLGVPLEKADRLNQVLPDKLLIAFAKKLEPIRAARADAAGARQFAWLIQRVAGQGENHEFVLADNRIIALQDILAVRIENLVV